MTEQQKFIQKAPSPEPLLSFKSNFSGRDNKSQLRYPNIPQSYIVPKTTSLMSSSNQTNSKSTTQLPKKLKSGPDNPLSTSCNQLFHRMLSNEGNPNLRPPLPLSSQQLSRNLTPLSQNFRLTTHQKGIDWKQLLKKDETQREFSSSKKTSTSVLSQQSRILNESCNFEQERATVSTFVHEERLSHMSPLQRNSLKIPNKLTSMLLSPPQTKPAISRVFETNTSTSIDFSMPKIATSQSVRASTSRNEECSFQNPQRMSIENFKKPEALPSKGTHSVKDLSSANENKRNSFGVVKKQIEEKQEAIAGTATIQQLQKYDGVRFLKEIKRPITQALLKENKEVCMGEESDNSEPVNFTSKQSKPRIEFSMPGYEKAKCSTKGYGIVRAYAAATNIGIVRNYNEDRVSILLNIPPPSDRVVDDWPKCSFFAVFDGHGGSKCADYLKDNLHTLVINDPNFPKNPKEALRNGFAKAEEEFTEITQQSKSEDIDRSGSCALVVLIVGDMCYVANVGDSRAILSSCEGAKLFSLSRDHKPLDDDENRRIKAAGGRIYQSQYPAQKQGGADREAPVAGPFRVFPGKLSVSRTFGDIEAKIPMYGGLPGCVIAVPEIKIFQLTPDCDFIVIASDGIFDTMTNRDVLNTAWGSCNNYQLAENIHTQTGIVADSILQEAINKQSFDNVTAVVIAFGNMRTKLFPKKSDLGNKENRQSAIGSGKADEPGVLTTDLSNSGIAKLKPLPLERGFVSLTNRMSAENKHQTVYGTSLLVKPAQTDKKTRLGIRPKKIATLEDLELRVTEKARDLGLPNISEKLPESSGRITIRRKVGEKALTANPKQLPSQ